MRKMPIGAEMHPEGVHFRVWAPKCHSLDVLIENKTYALERDSDGFFSGLVHHAKENTLYQFVLDGKGPFPDPTSRYQPRGPNGHSQVIHAENFKWEEGEWKGLVDKDHLILYEIHIGTFTQTGTWSAAIEKIPYLKDLGINAIQMMPIAEFPGKFNWGYDGVNLFAPTHNYGHPDDLRHFINAAHQAGIGVILDVVYNHFGPDGNYLEEFSDYYFKKEETEWGIAINFDGKESRWTRQFFIENAGYWIDEFHFDGLRMDACHSIRDKSTPHILLEMRRKVAERGKNRATFMTAENEQQKAYFVMPEEKGGLSFDAVYNEDFHHAACVRLIGNREAYFTDYTGKAQEFISSIKHNFLYQGQWYSWQNQNRGTPSIGMKACHFINFLENHDQVANTGSSQRLATLSHPREYRALTTLFLLAPQIPMLFQGQEYGATSPFYYFCDHQSELAKKIYRGRLDFLLQFQSINDPEVLSKIPHPNLEPTFLKSKLQWEEWEEKNPLYQLHKQLIAMRHTDEVFRHLPHVHIEGAVLTDDCMIARYFSESDERLLLVNFGADFYLFPASEPLLAPPEGSDWKILFSSERPEYGGSGYRKITNKDNWIITGKSSTIFYPSKQ